MVGSTAIELNFEDRIMDGIEHMMKMYRMLSHDENVPEDDVASLLM